MFIRSGNEGRTTFIKEQECIPVGCVPAARRPYAGVSLPVGGGGGVCSQGVVPGPGGSQVRGVSAPRGGGAWSRGGVPGPGGLLPGRGGAWSGGGCLLRGVVSQHALRQNPPL